MANIICKKCGYVAHSREGMISHYQAAKVAHELLSLARTVNSQRRRKGKKELHGLVKVGEKEYRV